MIAALISAFASAGGLILDKVVLARERVSLRVFLPIAFIFVFAFSLVLVPFLGRIDYDIAFLPNTLFLTFLMVLIAIASNVLFYQSIQKGKIHEHEMIAMMGPLLTIILAAVFFPEELDWRIFGLAIFAGCALLISRGDRKSLKPSPESYNLLLAMVLMSTESILIRELLYSYTPVALYAIRTFFLAVFFTLYYRPRFRQVTTAHWWMLAFSSLLGFGTMIGRFYAYEGLGIIYSTLIMMISPLIVFLASWEILHERIRARAVIAALIILLTVSVATVLTFH